MTDPVEALSDLAARIRADFRDLCVPPANWVKPRDGVIDVVVIGGGMCGLLAWQALTARGIRNTAIVDRSAAGHEGPWVTYARMETLRSPKHLTGPSLGMGPLTFRAWHRARFGEAAWEALDKIPRSMWMEYLRWYRDVLEIPVQNGVSVNRVQADGDLLRLEVSGMDRPSLLCRKLVMATGRDGTGGPNIPSFMDGVPRRVWAHSADEIDFQALRGRRVAVIGVGASAVDNAAEALEAGAAEVRHIVRRAEMPTINKMMGIGSTGFTYGYPDLSDAWRWRFMNYSFATQTPPPHGSTLRVSRHPNAYFHFGRAVTSVEERGGLVRLGFADGYAMETDYVILGTGFTTDPMARTEFGPESDAIELWRHVYTPPAEEQNEDLANFPYLNQDFSFRCRAGRNAPWLERVYCFNYGATASLGKVSGDIPGINVGAEILTRAIASKLYGEDIERHWQDLLDYEKPELKGHEWRVDPWPGEEPVRAAGE
ncbi:MAG: NAD(P)/FAD-dependent oxidoreductase [Pseudomonadota bacterium]